MRQAKTSSINCLSLKMFENGENVKRPAIPLIMRGKERLAGRQHQDNGSSGSGLWPEVEGVKRVVGLRVRRPTKRDLPLICNSPSQGPVGKARRKIGKGRATQDDAAQIVEGTDQADSFSLADSFVD